MNLEATLFSDSSSAIAHSSGVNLMNVADVAIPLDTHVVISKNVEGKVDVALGRKGYKEEMGRWRHGDCGGGKSGSSVGIVCIVGTGSSFHLNCPHLHN
ncbi:hypothetical protein Q3G72_033437 [Acer saccharum]|nr:hypothetical protein Q3G72_033437 [Acer saccharum]